MQTQRDGMEDGWCSARAEKPDLIVYHPEAFGEPRFAEKLRVPAVIAVPIPMLGPTGEFPVIGLPRQPLGARYDRMTCRSLHGLMRRNLAKCLAPRREQAGLPALAGSGLPRKQDGRRICVLHGYS